MSGPATRVGRRSTCSIWGVPTSTGWGWRRASACRARGSPTWTGSTAVSPRASPRRGRFSSRWCCKNNASAQRTRRMRGGRRGNLFTRIPATAGIHPSGDTASAGWIPAFAGMAALIDRVLCGASAPSALKGFFVFLLAAVLAVPAEAACSSVVAGEGARLWHVAAAEESAVAIGFLGHASFLIESPQGVRIVTDYNDMIRSPVTPDIVTMNNAHPTHYSEAVEPGVKFVLRGWDPAGGVASHRLDYRDVRIRNVPTNVREFGGTRYNGNSIFIFEVADLCIAHLGHLHHTLTPTHRAELGAIDVVMVPVDGTFTLNQEEMIEVLQQIGPKLVIPMHIFSQASLEKFLRLAGGFYAVHWETGSTVVLSKPELPGTPAILV